MRTVWLVVRVEEVVVCVYKMLVPAFHGKRKLTETRFRWKDNTNRHDVVSRPDSYS
jgi:hypothetical protein